VDFSAIVTFPLTVKKITSMEGEIAVTCSKHGKTRNAYRVSVGKPEGKRLLQRPKRMLGENVF
jgi:hypothetical protein